MPRSATTFPDPASYEILRQRTGVMLQFLLVLGTLGAVTDVVFGGLGGAAIVGVDVVVLVAIAALFAWQHHFPSQRSTMVAAASGFGAAIVGAFLASSLRGEFASAVMTNCVQAIAAAAFLPWGWKMQLVLVAMAAIGMEAVRVAGGPGGIGVQSMTLAGSCLAISVYLAVRHQRARGELAGHSADLAASRRAIDLLNRELQLRVAARENTLQSMNQRLEDFCRSLAIELQPSLALTRMKLDAMANESGLDVGGDSPALVSRLQSATLRAEETLAELLAYVALARQPLHRVPVDLSLVAAEHIRRLRELEPQRHVEITIAPGVTSFGDSAMLAEAVGHLVDNAWKFTRGKDDARIGIGSRENGEGEREFFVADNGVGFDMEHVGMLFRPFMRLERLESYPGHGMGLARVARIVARHGGRVRAGAAAREGAEFSFTVT